MEVYVKESLFVLDYNDNIVDTIFASDDHKTPGYAYDITITEANTGYSDLKFNMPNTIITADASQIKNPKLALLTPLVKLRYRREVYYTGDKPITVREPEGYGDVVTYKDVTYKNTYPDNLIEDYVMDYIVQPVDKKRDVLKLTTSFTAIDYPRFNLSKKRVGLVMDNTTLTKREWSLFQNKPMDKPGTIKYIQWTEQMSRDFGMPGQTIPTEWDPEHAKDYPLLKDNIIKMMANIGIWSYGLLATAFYWPITSTGRFDGKLYKKDGFLVLQLYDFYHLSKEGIDPDLYVDRYAWDWTQLYAVDSYLCPNNAKNYLYHILEGTNWTVAKKEDGTDDVDIVQKSIPNPKGSTTSTTLADSTCNISVSGSNCYNAITAVCQGLQLYPVFDCINRTVALKVFAGKNYGLSYMLGSNLNNNSTKLDGEKVITKLYVSGGKDYNGDANINIGYAERSALKYFNGFYKTIDSAPTTDVEGYWAIVDPAFSNEDFQVIKYKEDMTPYTETTHGILTKNYWNASENRQVYFYNNTTATWSLGTKLESGNWSGVVNGTEYIVDPVTGTEAPWNPNDDMYITCRSPYGTNYILNLRWAYQNQWITKEQILELYQLEQDINDLDYMFMDGYTKDRLKTQQDYNEAVNDYDIAQDGFQSTLYAMENKYYNVEGQISEGTTYCFHKAPQGTYIKYDPKTAKNLHYIKIFHCYECGETEFIKPNGTSAGADKKICSCGSTDVTNDEIYIPIYNDFEFVFEPSMYPYGTDTSSYEGPKYNPHLKGYFQRLVMSLDKANNDWSIEDYENRVSMIEPIAYDTGSATIDGYVYKLSGVYVRSTSGQIEVWNESIVNYLTYYGQMLDNLRRVNACLVRIQELQELYDEWERVREGYHATIQEKFGDYLIEGNYKNDEQPYEGLLFKEGLEASDKYSIPEVTYQLDVIASSGLVEYREPNVSIYECGDCGYSTVHVMDECPKCSSTVIIRNHDTYNDLVHILHNIGQIVPKAGDYVTIYDEPMGMFGVPGLITDITRYLDDPVKNKITLNTSYTDDEELVGNIITATNKVLSNADIYARTSVLKADGTVDATTMKESLDNSDADITIVGTNGNILLNSSGLRATDPVNPKNAMKYAGNGVFKTSNLDEAANEAVIWEKMISPSGINATYLNAGTIDTNKITVMSGLSGKVLIDQHGLTVKDSATKTSHLTTFDKSAAMSNVNYAKNWGINNNISGFIGVTTDNKPLIYTRGFLYAEEGSNIANWISSNQGFYHLDSNSQKDLWLSPGGISGVVNGNTDTMAIYAGGKFGVSTTGKLYAKEANINGTIVSNNATITGGSLKVGNNFSVDNNGNLTATNANINGTITTGNLTATGGSISNLSASNINATNLNATGGTFTNITVNGSSTFSGSMDASCITSGRISTSHLSTSVITTNNLSAQKISASQIEGGTLTINDASGGSFSIGTSTTHATTTGLNVGDAGIKMGNQGLQFTSYDGGKGAMGTTGANSIKFTTPTLIFSGVTDLQIGGKSGWSGDFRVDFPGMTGYYRLYFQNGILVDKVNG